MRLSGIAVKSCLLLFLILPAWPLARPDSRAPRAAGHIAALLPLDQVLRQGQTIAAVKDLDLYLDDVVKTDRGGRVRIALSDGSILNIGSDAQLHILQHDVKQQETTIEHLYGRLLITVVKVAKPQDKFDVRTPVAVAGVVGTKFGLRTETDIADVVCKDGTVRVRNTVSSVPGEVILQAGQFTHVLHEKPPSLPAPATPERIQAGEDATSIPDS